MNRILIVGCGDIAMRVAGHLRARFQLQGLIRKAERSEELRAAEILPLLGDLDDARSLYRLAGLAQVVLHLAPPPASDNNHDSRTRNLLAALSRGKLPQRLIYISTSGVYGDCNGDEVTESRPVRAHNARALRRLDAENLIRRWAGRNGVQASILRVPGIYAAERLPLERLRRGTPLITANEDSYTNHIHADDLARSVVAALRWAKPNRVYHTADDSLMKMGAYFDAVADAFAIKRAPRVSRAEAQNILPPTLLSFINESRRLSNARMKHELKLVLRYPTVADALLEITAANNTVTTTASSIAPPKPSAQLEMF